MSGYKDYGVSKEDLEGMPKLQRSEREELTVQPLWYRQKGESAQAYQAFMAYLMLGPDRTAKMAADATGKSASMMKRWMRKWWWRERSAAYEEHYMLLRLESLEAKRDQMFVEHEVVAQTALTLVSSKLTQLNDQMRQYATGETDEDPIRPDALTRLLDTAVKVQRTAILGRIEATDRTREEQEHLAEKYADELADLVRGVINDLNLTDEQMELAKQIVPERIAS